MTRVAGKGLQIRMHLTEGEELLSLSGEEMDPVVPGDPERARQVLRDGVDDGEGGARRGHDRDESAVRRVVLEQTRTDGAHPDAALRVLEQCREMVVPERSGQGGIVAMGQDGAAFRLHDEPWPRVAAQAIHRR